MENSNNYISEENKKLLLIDLCGRLPYGVICQYNCIIPIEKHSINKTNSKDKLKGIMPMPNNHIGFMIGIDKIDAFEGDIKPYLRPLSSMTEKEKKELNNVLEFQYYSDDSHMCESTDWLNAHHFDYRGLIEKGLALEAPKGMYI